MDAGRLDRRVTFKRPVTIDDGYTSAVVTLEVCGIRWAAFKPFNGREVYQNQGREARAGGSFWVRSDTLTREVDETYILTFENVDHDIISITQFGRRDLIEIIAAKSDRQ